MKRSLRNMLRAAYLWLPISDYHKYRIAGTLFNLLPALFGGLPEFQRWKSMAGKPSRPWEALLSSTEQDGLPGDIKLPASLEPRVSVVIPDLGKTDRILRCLRSIARCSISVPFEVIVVIEGSAGDTPDHLKAVSGVRTLRNEDKPGFIRFCNTGAAVAKGEYLCFLNNDTQVCDGWLDGLLRTFEDFHSVGLAGSKIVGSKGKLQEAGGIIWRNGSVCHFGRGEDIGHPEVGYAREVDFISSVSILIRKKLFAELGGFDESYPAARCADADLACKARSRGFRAMYQPFSVVLHHGDIVPGAGADPESRIAQVECMDRLSGRWREQLAANTPADGDADNAKDRGWKFRALVLDVWTPTPDRDAGSVIALNMMLILDQMGFQVTFIPSNLSYVTGYTEELQRAGIEVMFGPCCTSVKQHLKRSGARYDLVLMYRTGTVNSLLADVRKYCPRAKVLFHTQDLNFLRLTREAELFNDKGIRKAAEEMKQVEFAAIRNVDASIVVSTAEQELLAPELPDEKIHVLPLILDVRGSNNTFHDRRDILFVGGYQHSPNIDAVHYFVADVMPRLRQRLPGVRFIAVGSNPPAEIAALASEDVVIAGYVKDLEPLLNEVRVSVAPLRYGAGIKGKIGMAMAAGLPTVATVIAAEGMPLVSGRDILVADGLEDLADAVVRLYQDEALWKKLSFNGLAFAEQAWGGEAAWSRLHEILKDLGINTTRGAYPLKLYSPAGSTQRISVDS